VCRKMRGEAMWSASQNMAEHTRCTTGGTLSLDGGGRDAGDRRGERSRLRGGRGGGPATRHNQQRDKQEGLQQKQHRGHKRGAAAAAAARAARHQQRGNRVARGGCTGWRGQPPTPGEANANGGGRGRRKQGQGCVAEAGGARGQR